MLPEYIQNVVGPPGLDLRQLDPGKRLAHQAVVFLDVIRQHGLAVRADEAQIAAVLLGQSKLVLALDQTDQHGRLGDGFGDAGLRAAIDGDRFADGPFLVPPGRGVALVSGRGGEQARRRRAAQAVPPAR